jgi:hypothetical protein
LAVNFGELISFFSMVEFYADRPLLGECGSDFAAECCEVFELVAVDEFYVVRLCRERADVVKVLLVMTQPSSEL